MTKCTCCGLDLFDSTWNRCTNQSCTLRLILPYSSQMSFNHYDFYSDEHLVDLVWRRLEGTEISWLPYHEIITDNKSKTKGLTVTQARNLLSMSDGSDDDEQRKLLEFFWGPDPIPKPRDPYHKEPATCSHDWVEVILFHTPQMRCRWCDIKKSSS